METMLFCASKPDHNRKRVTITRHRSTVMTGGFRVGKDEGVRGAVCDATGVAFPASYERVTAGYTRVERKMQHVVHIFRQSGGAGGAGLLLGPYGRY